MKSKYEEHPWQISIFDLLDANGCLATAVPVSSETAGKKAPKVPAVKDMESYLEKGVRIETLAREQYAKKIEELSLSSLDEYIAENLKYDFSRCRESDASLWDMHQLVKALADVFRNLFKKIEKTEDSDPHYAMLVQGIKAVDFSLSLVDASESMARAARYLSSHGRRSNDLLYLTIRWTGRDNSYCELETYDYHRYKYTGREYLFRSDWTFTGDIATQFAWMYLIDTFEGVMDDPEKREEAKRSLEVYSAVKRRSALRDIAYELIEASELVWATECQRHRAQNFLPEEEFFRPDIWLNDLSHKTDVMALPAESKNGLTEAGAKFLLKFLGVEQEPKFVPSDKVSAIERLNERAYVNSGRKKPFMWVTDAYMVSYAAEADLFGAYSADLTDFNIQSALHWSNKFKCWFPSTRACNVPFGRYAGTIMLILKGVMSAKQGFVATRKYYGSLDSKSERAKAYQTKKNIPKRTLEAMENSGFNEHFGYVEFDELVDVKKAEIVSAQFDTFLKEYLPSLDLSNVQVRFRKLGNHKALGIYFPLMQCLCVDIGAPSSFIHELAHCMDYNLKEGLNLSDRQDFMAVRSQYEMLVREKVMTEKKELTGKYNLDYYLTPTEIFARCFEMYVVRILKVNSSICKPDFADKEYVYPENNRLDELMTVYFEKLLVTVGWSGEKETRASA